MEIVEQEGDGGGNTEVTPVKRAIQYRYWCFTYNKYDVEKVETMEIVLRMEADWYVFQEEVGESGTAHLQGTICWKKKKRLTECKEVWCPTIHWEKTKSVKASVAYCSKMDTRKPDGMQWTHGIELPDEVVCPSVYGWQEKVIEIVSGAVDKRKIHWFHEGSGGKGKSELCKWLVMKKNALMCDGKGKDAFHMISKFPNKRKVIVYDLPRSFKQDRMDWGALEQIKNGLIFSGKYDSTQVVFNAPHIIVFSNEEPLRNDVLSKDRLVVWDNKRKVIVYDLPRSFKRTRS